MRTLTVLVLVLVLVGLGLGHRGKKREKSGSKDPERQAAKAGCVSKGLCPDREAKKALFRSQSRDCKNAIRSCKRGGMASCDLETSGCTPDLISTFTTCKTCIGGAASEE
ncbi:uncharacterized protein LOC120329987 [Styela clava]|uniref:uncharacterized protein LOC120329987 n=1 Tax=Styela clava TaxID=7725 RepID=UPI001939EFA4|nr:uncharacterized protein LOC120329987 [Styela clava]